MWARALCSTTVAVAASLQSGLVPVETERADSPALAWVVDPAVAMELLGAGVAGWRITVRDTGVRADVLDALTRSGAAFLRTEPQRLQEAIELGWLPGIATRVSVAVDTVAVALDAIAAGAVDLVVGDWDSRRGRGAARRDRPAAARGAHRAAARDRDRRRARAPRAPAVHRLAGADRRLGSRAPALHLGPGA